LKDFINEASTCREEPVSKPYPVDMEKEFSQFHQFVMSKEDELLSSKTPGITNLVKITTTLDRRLEVLSKVSFGAFLKMAEE